MMKDVIMVGGGVIGCSIALKLAQSGLTVAVIERSRVGGEASRAAAGMLSPQTEASGQNPFLDLCLRSRSMYRDFARLLTEMSGIDVEYRDEGTLCVVAEGESESEIDRWSSWQIGAGLELELLPASLINDIEPAVTQSAARAIFIPNDHQVENRRLMDALDVACRRAGVEIIEGHEATSLIVEHEKATGVMCGEHRFDAGAVVVAAGCWSSRLLEPVGLNITVIPARGQMIALRAAGFSINHTLHSSKCYLVPRNDGRVLAGATVEYAGFHKSITVSGINSLLKAAIELVPLLESCEIVEAWSGLRPDTADHLPVIGSTGIDNLWLATGHFRNGILLAPITAELIAECIISGRVPNELKPFGIERFEETSVVGI
jgi:glycine oxidase